MQLKENAVKHSHALYAFTTHRQNKCQKIVYAQKIYSLI